MQNPTEKNVTYPLAAMLGLIALSGAVQGCIGQAPHNLGHALTIVLKVLASFSAFVWYRRDSDAHRYRRSVWRNFLFNAVGFLFIPWYLLRTRARGKRLVALLKLGGVGMLILVALLLGAIGGHVLTLLV